MSRDEPHNHGPSPNLSCVRCATERPSVDVVIHPVYGPQISNWPERVPPGRYEPVSMDRDRLLLTSFLGRLHRTAALSVPPEDLAVAVDEHLADFPDILEAAEQDVPGQP